MTRIARLLAACALLAAPAARAAPPPFPAQPGPPGIGTDPAQADRCLACHRGLADAWGRPHSHALLLDCATCHAVTGSSGKGHADRPPCARCHSEAAHPAADAACGSCHAVHGSANAFLVRESVDLPGGGTAAIHVTKPEGASRDGLVRQGVPGATAGTGLCEACHRGTAHYDREGTAASHEAGWCGTCHAHADGFRPAADEASRAP